MQRRTHETSLTQPGNETTEQPIASQDEAKHIPALNVDSSIREKAKKSATDVMDKIDEALTDADTTHAIGRTAFNAIGDGWQTIRQKTPEFIKNHKREIILGIGAYTTGKIAANKRSRIDESTTPLHKLAISRLQTLPTEAKSRIHEMTS